MSPLRLVYSWKFFHSDESQNIPNVLFISFISKVLIFRHAHKVFQLDGFTPCSRAFSSISLQVYTGSVYMMCRVMWSVRVPTTDSMNSLETFLLVIRGNH